MFRNKLDEPGVVVSNKTRLATKWYNLEERIDFDETFPPMVRLEAIRTMLAVAFDMGIKLF